MPTAYTAPIGRGATFKDFALGCATAILGDTTATTFEPSTYHKERAEEAERWLAEVLSLTPEQCTERVDKDHDNSVRVETELATELATLRAKYDAMLAEVNAWIPPSPEHVVLQQLMRMQITDSIAFDCDHTAIPITKPTGAEWRKHRIKRLRADIKDHRKSYEAAIRDCERKNRFAKLLLESLTPTPTEPR